MRTYRYMELINNRDFIKKILLLICFFCCEENMCSLDDNSPVFPIVPEYQKQDGLSPFMISAIVTGGASILGVIITAIVEAVLKTRFKRQMRHRRRARKKEVKQYGILRKDINVYEKIEELRLGLPKKVFGQDKNIDLLLSYLENFLTNKDECKALFIHGVSGVGKNLTLSYIFDEILDKSNYLFIDPSSFDPSSKSTLTQQIFEGEKYVSENREQVVPARMLYYLDRLEKENAYGFVVVDDAHKLMEYDEFAQRVRTAIDKGILIVNNKVYNMKRIKWIFTANINWSGVDDVTKSLFKVNIEQSIRNRFYVVGFDNLSAATYSEIFRKDRMQKIAMDFKELNFSYDEQFIKTVGDYCYEKNEGVRLLDRIYELVSTRLGGIQYREKKGEPKKSWLLHFDKEHELVSAEAVDEVEAVDKLVMREDIERNDEQDAIAAVC